MTIMECGHGSEEHTPGDEQACQEERIVVAVGQRLSAKLSHLEDLIASTVDDALRQAIRETLTAMEQPVGGR
jgi:hypothetical protein